MTVKQIFDKLFIFILAILILSFIIGVILRKSYFEKNTDKTKIRSETSALIEKASEEVVAASMKLRQCIKKGKTQESDWKEVASHFNDALSTLKKVNIKTLKENDPVFAEHFQDELLAGVTMIAEALETKDMKKFSKGNSLMNKWTQWFKDHNNKRF